MQATDAAGPNSTSPGMSPGTNRLAAKQILVNRRSRRRLREETTPAQIN